MSRIFKSGWLLLRQTGQLRGTTFFTDHRDFGFEWGKFLAAEKWRKIWAKSGVSGH